MSRTRVARIRGSLSASRGFTLIELVVVVLLLSIIVGMVAVNLGTDDTSEVRNEAERLALLINAAQQDAILDGQVLALALEERGYHFLRLNDAGTLAPIIGDELLRPRELAPGIMVSAIEIAGNEQKEQRAILLQPSGELEDFAITLSKGTARWQIKGSLTEGIRSVSPLSGHAES
jgi:general secretion pathway protein H